MDNHGNPINTKQVIESDGFGVVHLYNYRDNNYREALKETIIENSSKFQDDELIISLGGVSIPNSYICSEIFTVQKGICYRLVKENPSDGPQRVTISNDDIKYYDIGYYAIDTQNCIHSFKNYEEIVVSKDAPLLGYDPPFHGKCWIYPIRGLRDIENTISDNRAEAETFLREQGRMGKLVPDYIVELIQKYNVLKNENLSKEEIHNAYIRLILDKRFGVEKPSEQKK